MYSDASIMLTLASITYRGFNLMRMSESARYARLRQTMVECFNTLAPVKDRWRLVWGPASFRPLTVGVDDAVMYVAQNLRKPTTFVVAIRGTNPISLSDWISGDLLATETVQWPYGSQSVGADISLSTALGLSILQHLRSTPLDNSSSAPEPQSQITWLESLRTLASRWFRMGTRASDGFNSLAELLAAAKVKQAERASISALKTLVNEQNRLLPERLDPLTLLNEERPHSLSAPGIDIRTYLRGAISQAAQPIDIYVTGHSKGGALSSTFALWLADTQGAGPVPSEDQWDKDHNATVHAYSFAGPTAGNDKFALHSDAVIGDRCWRIFNQQDIVPRAWVTRDLEQIPGLYGSNAVEQGILSEVCASAIKSVGHLNYHQIGKNLTAFESPLISGTFLEQAVHQHLDAYFAKVGLSDVMNMWTFFTPVP